MTRTLIVAHRLPVTLTPGTTPVLDASPGGLATALRHVHGSADHVQDSLWLGWLGPLDTLDDMQLGSVRDALAERRLVSVRLSDDEVRRYADGFANGVLWPLFHYAPERMQRDPSADWEVYRRVNERFAEAVIEHARPGDRIWIHDYQLALVPGLVRQRLPRARIGFFLHIPFPATEVFRVLPMRQEILGGMLGADHVGVHTADYARHVREAALQLARCRADGDNLRIEGRQVTVQAHPIGIDARAFAERGEDPRSLAMAERWRGDLPTQGGVVLGVDRLDYTKGIPRRLLAIERLLERWPQWCERLRFVQLAVPTREGAEQYRGFRRDVNELVGRINGRFGTPDWTPIHLIHRSVDPIELAGLYRAADVMVVTPLRDGMNLVAKEFCATRVDEGGVLVLSELAGAAAQLDAALLVNPYDLDQVALAIATGLSMTARERADRMTRLRASVMEHDVHRWASSFLAALAFAPEVTEPPIVFDASTLGRRLRAAKRRLILLDYDGTLVRHVPVPDSASPDPELRALLSSLAADPRNALHVVSGRGRDVLEAWLGDLPIALHAEHGALSRLPGQSWTGEASAPIAGYEEVLKLMREAQAATPGSLVELKTTSAAWHYRMVDPKHAARSLATLRARLLTTIAPGLELLDGSKVLEVRPRRANKGLVAQRLIGAATYDVMLAIGDDRTDEDMFNALPPDAITIHVGDGTTNARHRLATPARVRSFLRSLVSAPVAVRVPS